MATTQSQFSRVSKKILVFICEKLVDADFPIGNPYNHDFEEAYKILKSVSNYFNIRASHEDVEFFSKLLEINDDLIADLFANGRELMKNKELFEQLVIPVAKSYNLDYSVWGTCTYTEYKVQEFDSYDETWVKDSALQQRNDGNWDLYDGRDRSETDYDNFEETDYIFDGIEEVDENPIKESILSKLILENTSEVINSLDRATLVKLKNLISQKLSS